MKEILGYLLSSAQEDYKTKWIKPEDYSKVLCSNCKRLLVDNYFNTDVKIQKMKYDFILIVDGGKICISEKVKEFILENKYKGIELKKLPSMNDIYILICKNIINIQKDLLCYYKKCEICGDYISITAGKYYKFQNKKRYVTYINERVDDGFFITDVKFGENTQKHHRVVVGVATYNKLNKVKIKGFITTPIISEF